MDIKYKIFPDDSKEFPWDKEPLETFKKNIKDKEIKCRMDDIFLLGILRSRKFDQERSMQLLINYYTRRCQYPMYFNNLLPSKLEHVLSQNIFHFMPNPDQHGRYIFIMEIGNWDPSDVSIHDYFRASLLYLDYQLNFHRTQVNGIVWILNSAGTTFRQLLQCTPRFINAYTTLIFRNSYQLRIKELHYVNLSVFMKAFLTLLVPLLPAKMKSRAHFDNGVENLHKFVNPQYLPKELGGDLPKLDTTESCEMLRENKEFFRMNEKFVKLYEESKAQNFTDGRFRFLDQEEEFKNLVKNTELKYKELEEDPESYLSRIEKDIEFDITHL